MGTDLDPDQQAWLQAQRQKQEAEFDQQLQAQAEKYHEETKHEREYPEIPKRPIHLFLLLVALFLGIAFSNSIGWILIIFIVSLSVLANPKIQRFWRESDKRYLAKTWMVGLFVFVKLAWIVTVIHTIIVMHYHPISEFKGNALIPPGSHAFYHSHGLKFTESYAIKENPTEFLISLAMVVLIYFLGNKISKEIEIPTPNKKGLHG